MLFGTIRAVSKRAGAKVVALPHETTILCDRTHPMLGNLRHAHDESGRDRVIELHDEDVERDVQAGGQIDAWMDDVAGRVHGGENIALVCWCKPKRCHVDNYVKRIQARVEALRE